jgi:hypothetical protein
MTTTLRHIALQPLGRAVDAGTLVRSLYEHLVHFAWLAADPSPARMEEWRKNDLQMRLRADNDARLRGEKLYTDNLLDAAAQCDASHPQSLVRVTEPRSQGPVLR